MELRSNKPWVQVRINGSAPQTFILDSGCAIGSVVARECADRLRFGLGAGTRRNLGAGEGVSVAVTSMPDVTLDAGGDTLHVPRVGVFPLAHVSPYEGRRVDGLLGADFLGRNVVELDYAHRSVRTFDPATFAYAGPGTSIPITLEAGLVVAEGAIAPPGGTPIPCRFVVDTGVRATVIVYHPFTVAHALVGTQPRVLTATVGGGAGGETKGDVGRLDSLRIGGVVIARPTAIFSRDTAGVFAGTRQDAIVGGELLRRFTVILDCAHGRMILEPNAGTGAPFDYDMSGLFLVSPGPDFRRVVIQSVAQGTPGAGAGLEKGDEIVRVNGREAARMTLDDVRAALMRAGGECRLEVQHAGARREVTL
ncbi:MAG TPA: aspartyl protease family protein, partial [Candidatus Eisenbacteria bacterium]|nr:aspartyl protease family protein [Candidatus Eisenbacteria bacterium]